jgi:hypothetical protein
MSTTRSLAYAAAVSTAAALVAYAAFRLAGADAAASALYTCVFAMSFFVIGAVAVRIKAKAFTASASAAIVGAGASMTGAMFAASRSADAFMLLFAGFFLGVALCVFALMRDLDEHASPKLLLAVPMAQMLAFMIVFGL